MGNNSKDLLGNPGDQPNLKQTSEIDQVPREGTRIDKTTSIKSGTRDDQATFANWEINSSGNAARKNFIDS
ncbi:hypothetical protein Trydic_g16616 [Trypoxylus dichotomus]